jgi:hypothetical protein
MCGKIKILWMIKMLGMDFSYYFFFFDIFFISKLNISDLETRIQKKNLKEKNEKGKKTGKNNEDVSDENKENRKVYEYD